MTQEGNTPGLTEEQIQAQMIEAVGKQDWQAVKKLAAELDKLAKAEQAKAKAELEQKLAEVTAEVKKAIDKATAPLIDKGVLDGADGIWYAYDFGDGVSSCRVQKKAARAAGAGGSSGKSSYVADPRKSQDLLEIVGDAVMFAEDTTVTLAKEEHVMPAGTTLKEAYDYSTNGGWRNRVRMAILKAANKAQA